MLINVNVVLRKSNWSVPMGQYDFTYEFPSDFDNRVRQLLQQDYSGVQVASAFQRCSYEYEDIDLAYYAGLRGKDYWNKRALDFTIEGAEEDINILKNHARGLTDAISRSLRPNVSGFVVRKILYLIDDRPLLPATNEERLNADILAANSVLSDLIKIGERVCSNATYRNDSSENSINDYFRDTLSLMGYTEVKDQTRHGVSISGKDAGEVDILIAKDGKEIAIFEGLKLDSVNTAYIDLHIDKAIKNYNALGTATFIVSYVSAQNFESFWERYTAHIQNYVFPLRIRRELSIKASPNAAIRIAEMILSRDGFDFPVYYIALNLN